MDTSKSNTIISKRVLSVLPLASILVIAFLLTEFHPLHLILRAFLRSFFQAGFCLHSIFQ